MNFTAQRLYTDGLSTVSRWTTDGGHLLCFALEPGADRQPHPGIPAGKYPLRLRTAGLKHEAYLRRFGSQFHRGMIEIANVPGRSDIEFHTGNSIADTLGCVLAGEQIVDPRVALSKHWEVERSIFAYKAAYPVLRDAVLAGPVLLEIRAINTAQQAAA